MKFIVKVDQETFDLHLNFSEELEMDKRFRARIVRLHGVDLWALPGYDVATDLSCRIRLCGKKHSLVRQDIVKFACDAAVVKQDLDRASAIGKFRAQLKSANGHTEYSPRSTGGLSSRIWYAYVATSLQKIEYLPPLQATLPPGSNAKLKPEKKCDGEHGEAMTRVMPQNLPAIALGARRPTIKDQVNAALRLMSLGGTLQYLPSTLPSRPDAASIAEEASKSETFEQQVAGGSFASGPAAPQSGVKRKRGRPLNSKTSLSAPSKQPGFVRKNAKKK